MKYRSADAAASFFSEGNRLIYRWQRLSKTKKSLFTIGETGFGFGLNFLRSWSLWEKYAPTTATLYFISSEQDPITPTALSRLLAEYPELETHATELLDHYPPLTPGVHLLSFQQGRIKLILMLGDALSCYEGLLLCGDPLLEATLREYVIDAWCLDNFSPSNHLFSTIAQLSKPTTTLVSSLVTEAIQHGLKDAGFDVGHLNVKASSLIAEYRAPSPKNLSSRHTPWHGAVSTKNKSKQAVVLGAGLAGCYIAHALACRGWSITLLDAENNLCSGASYHRQAVLYPKFSAHYSPLNDFMLTSYLYAIRCFQALMTEIEAGELSGILQLAHSPKECLAQAKLSPWLSKYPMLGRWVDAYEASDLAGIALESGGLFMPQTGWLNMQKICHFLVQTPGIHWIPNTHVTSIVYKSGDWYANEHRAKVLVIANAQGAANFSQTAHLPLQSVRGQMSVISSHPRSEALRIPLCALGNILPAIDGQHLIGATYQPGVNDTRCYAADDQANIKKLMGISKVFASDHAITGHWAGVRAVTPDYLPLVGPVAHAEKFKVRFKGLANDSKRYIPIAGAYHDGLYICAGFGSRGLTTIPLCAEWLARSLNQEPMGLSRAMLQSFSPARFLRREIIRNTGVAILKPT